MILSGKQQQAVKLIQKIIENEGGLPGDNIHSWRCEYPDKYREGPCTCTEELAEMIVEALSEGYITE